MNFRSCHCASPAPSLGFIGILLVWTALADLAHAQSKVDFARDIRPLLSDRCFSCHGPDPEHRESDLRLDELASMTEDRGGYRVLQPGEPQASELVRRITSTDPDEVMPPAEFGKPLTQQEIRTLEQWVADGAAWQQHWAYVAPKRVEIPDMVESLGESKNWIDRFIAVKLEEAGTQFSPAADSVTLARRLSFDLTGLPPTQRALQSLQNEAKQESDAWLRYVDSLLSSPAFGERMASYWLDLTRFADTVGYHGDQDHNISPYRDYVINAFNDNLPFDQFTIDQLAGDLLEQPTEEQIVATGYNRLLQTSHEGGVQPKEYLAIYQADRVRNVSAVWFGATIGCAQCHDHKYDPFTAKDFYSLASFFADIDEAQHFRVGSNSLPTKRPPEIKSLSRSELLQLQLEKVYLEKLVESGASKTALDEQQKRITKLEQSGRMCMVTQSITPRVVKFLPRGNWLDESGPEMQPAVPAFLGQIQRPGRATRLDLARWLVDPDKGSGLLTARVYVNRVWFLLFGRGLSASTDDFGGQGEPPSHPELLDQLSLEFVRSGWDTKHLIRLIVSSRTYQQDSLVSEWAREHDPQNRLFARQSRFRLPAEMVRDASLASAGLLVRQIGGRSVKPYQPVGYYRHLNFPTRRYRSTVDEGQWRRGVYVHWQRQFLHPMLAAFDAPTREECTAQRPQSNTPLAALVWLNDPSFIEAARGLAIRVANEHQHHPGTKPPASFVEGDEALDREEHRISRMFEIATSRSPDAKELQTLKNLYSRALDVFTGQPENAQDFLKVGLWEAGNGEPVSAIAARTTVARAILNLAETYTRN